MQCFYEAGNMAVSACGRCPRPLAEVRLYTLIHVTDF